MILISHLNQTINKMKIRKPVIFIALIITAIAGYGQFAQWRGPNRDGIFPDTSLLKVWPEAGPDVLFVTKGIGLGNSSTIATKSRIYATGNIDTLEYLSCLDLSGNILWKKSYGRCWIKSYKPARCTPTLEENRIYTISGLDEMSCFDATTGDVIWKVDIHKKYSSKWDVFGVSESPLIIDSMIVTTPAGDSTTVIALNKMTGELIWKSKSVHMPRSNMSPVLINHCGKKYIITATETHVLGVDATNGEILWTYEYNFLYPDGNNRTILANSPIYKDSCIWISDGWDVKSVMLEIAPDGRSVSEKFTDQTFDNQNHGVVLVDGFLYGSNFTGRHTGKWVCMNWYTGEITWIGNFHNSKGPLIYADDLLYIIDERQGNMALFEASPEEFKVISSFKIKEGNGPYWSRPTIYNRMLLVRHGDVLIAYDIAKK